MGLAPYFIIPPFFILSSLVTVQPPRLVDTPTCRSHTGVLRAGVRIEK